MPESDSWLTPCSVEPGLLCSLEKKDCLQDWLVESSPLLRILPQAVSLLRLPVLQPPGIDPQTQAGG